MVYGLSQLGDSFWEVSSADSSGSIASSSLRIQMELLYRVVITEFVGDLFFTEYATSFVNVDFVFVLSQCCFCKLLSDFVGVWALVIHNTEQVSYV